MSKGRIWPEQMVNTFLVHPDFRESAKLLNWQRLGKQRVEAQQILDSLNDLRYLAQYFGQEDFPRNVDTTLEQRHEWTDRILSIFKSQGKALLITDKMTVLCQSVPHRCKSGNQLYIQGDIITEVKGKRTPIIVRTAYWWEYVLPGQRLITSSWKKHTAVMAWLGFEEALQAYINATIEEWIARGYENNMPLGKVTEDPLTGRPTWTLDPAYHNLYKAVLLHKEIDRCEPAWYLRFPDFIEQWTLYPEFIPQLIEFGTNCPRDWWTVCSRESLIAYGVEPTFIWP